MFDLDTRKTATNNFSQENKLGEGGFDPAYKLEDGQEIAIEKLSMFSAQDKTELKNEVQLIAKLRTIIRLLFGRR
ncbi:G-type lectin S-receptor-like serine/threonine-protein kinase [Nymphaea thermarum]|nr:G-type lectin S-receptor-like serine/threonine-protein kinase [Nymphaea thermarum]